MEIFSNFKLDGYFNFFHKKYKEYPITLYFDYLVDNTQINFDRVNLFLTHEPNELFGIHNWVYQNHYLFDAVISWNEKLVSSIPNGVEFHCSWRTNSSPEWEWLGDKQFEVSFLSGVKDLTEGHKLRHKIYNIGNQVTIPKKWYKVLDDFDHENGVRPGYHQYSKDLSHIPDVFKFDPLYYGKKFLFENSMFHIGIENVKHNNWINDRLWSCFASKVVPIYWGCPNIEDFGYDERGVIRFEDEKDLIVILNSLTEQDYYDRLPYINHNYQVNKLDTLENKLSYFLDELIKLNNL